MTALLEVEGLDVSYGPLQVLFGVDLTVTRGDAAALLGTNGAGKSTLLKAVSGLVRPGAGRVALDGHDITQASPAERVALGMTLVEGGKATFPTLSVRDNIRLGAFPFLDDDERVEQRLAHALELFPQLGSRLDQAAGTLSGGEQQMAAIARALMPEPELLMIDELSLGLAPVVMQDILAVIEQVLASGVTVLLVEQSLNVAMSIAETAHFMEKGEIRFSGRGEELLERGDLARSVFFGSTGAAS